MVDVFEQVEEELRSGRYKRLARTWLPVAGGVLLVALIAALAWWGWQKMETAKADRASIAYQRGLESLEANNLVEEHAPLVGVVVGRNNPRAFSRSPVALVQEIGDGPPDAGRNLLARTAGVALDHERDITIRE